MSENEGRLTELIWKQQEDRDPHVFRFLGLTIDMKIRRQPHRCTYITAGDGEAEERSGTIPNHAFKRFHVEAKILHTHTHYYVTANNSY